MQRTEARGGNPCLLGLAVRMSFEVVVSGLLLIGDPVAALLADRLELGALHSATSSANAKLSLGMFARHFPPSSAGAM